MAVLGLIAGSGPLPFEVARAARERGLSVAIAAIEDNADPAIEREASGRFAWLNAGELGKLIEFLRGAGSGEVILAGAVSKRALLADPAILRAVADELAAEGLPVVASTRYLESRMTRRGVIAGSEPDAALRADFALGLRVIASLGPHDVGQACLVRQGTVLAVEALEGTDRMLRRGAEFGAGAALVKAAKRDQDMRFDVPVIGPTTLEVASECRLRAIGLEVGRTLVLEPERTLALARAAGIALVGLGPEDA